MLSTLLGLCTLQAHSPPPLFLVHIFFPFFPVFHFSDIFHHDGKCMQRGQANGMSGKGT